MAKNYNQIVSGFTKLISQGEKRIEELVKIANEAEEQSARKLTEANLAILERNKTASLVQKLNDLIGS